MVKLKNVTVNSYFTSNIKEEEHSKTFVCLAEFKPHSAAKDDRSVGWLQRALNAQLYRYLNPFDELKAERLLFGAGAGVVHPDYGQLGIIAVLIRLQMEMLKIRGAGGGLTTSSGSYSAKALEKAGAHVMRSIDYATFQLPDGTRPFAQVDMGVHRTRYVFAYKLQQTPARAKELGTKSDSKL